MQKRQTKKQQELNTQINRKIMNQTAKTRYIYINMYRESKIIKQRSKESKKEMK
jgi:hypothetical protein